MKGGKKLSKDAISVAPWKLRGKVQAHSLFFPEKHDFLPEKKKEKQKTLKDKKNQYLSKSQFS